MATHVALLRGVNLGKANKVPMAELRALATRLGYGNPRTLLNSGNLVLESAEDTGTVAARLEAGLAADMGVKVRVFVLTAEELATLVASEPFGDRVADPSRLLLAVADAGGLARLRALVDRDWGPEALVVTDRAGWIWCPDGISSGLLAEAALKALGQGGTTRNLATARKLLDLAGG